MTENTIAHAKVTTDSTFSGIKSRTLVVPTKKKGTIRRGGWLKNGGRLVAADAAGYRWHGLTNRERRNFTRRKL